MEQNDYATDGDYFYPGDDEVGQGLRVIEGYLRSSRMKRYFFKRNPENEKKRREQLRECVIAGASAIGTVAVLACTYEALISSLHN